MIATQIGAMEFGRQTSEVQVFKYMYSGTLSKDDCTNRPKYIIIYIYIIYI